MSYSDTPGSSSKLSSGQRISVPDGWKWTDADSRYGDDYRSGSKQDGDAPLGILTYLEGKKFVGGGSSSAKTPNNNALEINLFQETLTFSTATVQSIPNRGFKCQGDICLNAIMYLQTVNDVTNCQTGLPDGSPSLIHAENGMFIHVPATDKNPVVGATIGRLGSIPTACPSTSKAWSPPPPPRSTDPLEVFPALVAANNDTARIPQVLDIFVKTGTITDEIMADPTNVLRAVNQTRNILNTITLTISTNAQAANGNASAASVDFTLWIETVGYQVPLPAGATMNAGKAVTVPFEGITYTLTPPKDIVVPAGGQSIPVQVTELQYFQMVMLQFGILSWPHPTVSTLKPDAWSVDQGDDAWKGV
ncbi:hypothetical protein B0T18DRAFT_449200 [Schizothecium vesticola]|uniref:Uncharacterized protein n=1 Tax=Schizothecium vesticola TaxID=314040 RepID=A0AA40JZA5_9PEZI|nr:hypothetical protein B0T18DRAFT_449200 [Schizothecium vesticola]